jgi:hypothetical protein
MVPGDARLQLCTREHLAHVARARDQLLRNVQELRTRQLHVLVANQLLSHHCQALAKRRHHLFERLDEKRPAASLKLRGEAHARRLRAGARAPPPQGSSW